MASLHAYCILAYCVFIYYVHTHVATVHAGLLLLDEFEDRKELLHLLLDHNL